MDIVLYHGGRDIGETGVLKFGMGLKINSGQDAGAIFLTPSKKYAQQYVKSSGRLYEAVIDLSKEHIFDATNQRDLDQLEGITEQPQITKLITDSIQHGAADWATLGQYLEELEQAGFTGAKFLERPGENIVQKGESAFEVSGPPVYSYGFFHEVAVNAVNDNMTDTIQEDNSIFWHGTPSGDLRGGSLGLHIGTYKAAKQALEARIGVPAEGEWDGTREYGKTLIAGKKRLLEIDPRGFLETGENAHAPDNNYYPTGKALYGNSEPIPLTVKPIIIPVRIIGSMSNSRTSPHTDVQANALMKRQVSMGNARNGYYYINEGEDTGSISAVVPNMAHLQILSTKPAWWNEKGTNWVSPDKTQGELIEDWLVRHKIQQENGKYVFYHATPIKGGATTVLRAGTLLEDDQAKAIQLAGRDRDLKPADIKVIKVLLSPEQIQPGHWASLREDYQIPELYSTDIVGKNLVLFKDLPIGGTFIERSEGSGARKGVISTMTYRKDTKSSATIIGVSGDYGTRHIGGVVSFGAYSTVSRQSSELPETQTPEQVAADYWNEHLEHNRLRTGTNGMGADTNAGAFLAWMLEGTGDILRESSKSWADRGYMFEKLNRLKNYIKSRDWLDPISPREEADRKAILEEIKAIPAGNEFVQKVKAVMIPIIERNTSAILPAVEELKPLLPAAVDVTLRPETVTLRPETEYDYKHVMNDFNLRPLQIKEHLETVHHIKANGAKKGYEREIWGYQHEFAHKNPDWEYRPDEIYQPEVLKQYPDGKHPRKIEDVTGIPGSQMPLLRSKDMEKNYPRILTMKEYEKDWKPQGWKLIHVGPTSTWRQEWGEWEAIRDLVQNALDETESYQYGTDKEGFWISDNGKGVGISSFLLGPPKLKPDYARGKFGEGMKIASLALVRAGYNVHVETVGREVWMIFIEQEVGGGETVQSLAGLWRNGGTKIGTKFHIIGYKGDDFHDRFFTNLPKWDILAQSPSKVSKPIQRYNSLIKGDLGGSSPHRIYARDIYMKGINSSYSYNLWSFDMSPDRFGAKDESQVWYDAGRVWTQISTAEEMEYLMKCCSEPPIIKRDETYNLTLESWYMGVNPVTEKSYLETMKENGDAWRNAWKKIHGESAVIRTNDGYDAIVRHLGYEPKSVQYGVRAALGEIIKTDKQLIDESQERLRDVEVIPEETLSPRQLAHLKLAQKIARDVDKSHTLGGVHAGMIPPASERVRTAGLYGRNTQEIFIAVEQLNHGRATIDTTIHELAHHTNGADDGQEEHNHEMTRIAGEVVSYTAARRYDIYIEAADFSW